MRQSKVVSKEEREELEANLTEQGFAKIRCSDCGRFLGYERIEVGTVLIKCKNCHLWTEITGQGLTKNG